MKRNYIHIIIGAVIISVIGVYVIDYFSHLLFSNPMETLPYFMAKWVLYFVFSIVFLYFIDVSKKEFIKVAGAGIIVSLLFGFYYNIIPIIMEKFFSIDFYPFGIALKGLTFLNMGLLGPVLPSALFTPSHLSEDIIRKNLY